MDERALRLAGSAVARLHREGVLHGDLNAGNLLFSEVPEVFFLDLRHSTRAPAPPGDRARRANLLRLARSLHKLGAVNGWAWPEHPWDALAAGYVEGWGLGEPWLTAFVAVADRGYPLSARFW